MVPSPGATRSGFARSRDASARDELKPAIVSSSRVSEPLVLDAPTVSTHGALPGAVTPPYCSWPSPFLPRLPAAVTTTMPASTTRLTASVSGSVQYDSRTAGAHRQVDDADVVLAAFASTQSSAAICVLIVPRPLASSTFSATSVASGAMPALVGRRVAAVAGNDAGDVRAVPVVVVG